MCKHVSTRENICPEYEYDYEYDYDYDSECGSGSDAPARAGRGWSRFVLSTGRRDADGIASGRDDRYGRHSA